MSFYNMVNGFTPSCLIVLPMLGKHPDQYPRFRDCFLKDEEHPEYDFKIHVYTRTGGLNRQDYEDDIKTLRETKGFITDFDDSFDSTFASWVFEVPDQWKQDFDLIINDRKELVSDDYVNHVKKTYPLLAESEVIDITFKRGKHAGA